ncbi:MAG TPA: transaldolase [Oligoflexia bacterium]|nr:transaldolase [Oligoflexia bacterium]HMP27671.1 transaldolase [Oligoflexia bacterium]
MVETLNKLSQIGQSIWLDNLSRDLITSGELVRLIEAGVSGITSNPTIFKNAIAGSTSYDKLINEELKINPTLSAEQIAEVLMVDDVRQACEAFLPLYNSTFKKDGYVSLEVPPKFAYDTQGTVECAKRLWQKVSKPNLMIKIPATKEGLSAISQTLALGINVNVTLIFAPNRYQEVARAFLDGAEKFASAGGDLSQLGSVASFFVSRVDSQIEKLATNLESIGKLAETFRVGISNSLFAYKKYLELFHDEIRFQRLKAAGLRPQRALWASTSVKSPKLSPLFYLKALALPETVNTLPSQTLSELIAADPNTINRTDPDFAEAESLINTLTNAGIDQVSLFADLESNGIKIFAESYDQLVAAIGDKINKQ